MSGLKLFRTDTTNSGMTEVMPRLAEIEADVQSLVEAHMETLLGVRFLASEYGTGPVHVDGQAIPHDLHDQRHAIPHPCDHGSPWGRRIRRCALGRP